MNKTELAQLKEDWSALEVSVRSSSEAQALLKKALNFLVRTERNRRNNIIFPGCDKPGAYPASILSTAQVIILVNLTDKSRHKLTWLEAATCREDILCARALREKLDSLKRWPFRTTGPKTAKLDIKAYWQY